MEGCGVFLLEEFVDVGEGRRRWSRGAYAEAEAVGLVDVVIGILAKNHSFYRV